MAQASPPSFLIHNDTELANDDVTADGTTQEEEPSAADYDPTMDMQEDKLRHTQQARNDDVPSSAYHETKQLEQDILLPKDHIDRTEPNPKFCKRNKDEFDMFADEDDIDMFTKEPPTSTVDRTTAESTRAVPVPSAQALNMTMLDDWDDQDGYYKVTLGELLDNRYQVQSNLGKGMFSGVVRAMDQTNKAIVAIKVIRNNETM